MCPSTASRADFRLSGADAAGGFSFQRGIRPVAGLMQDKINAIAASISAAEELKAYKELLDSGASTQEEFDAKKRQILGL